MSFGNPNRLPQGRGPGQGGFTLVELLVASALALVVFGILLNMLVSTGRTQVRNQLQVSLDESMRASLELMSMDLREAMGPRVLLPGSGPADLSGYTTGSDMLTVTRMAARDTFYLSKPAGFPSNLSYASRANTPIVQPNAVDITRNCVNVFTGNDYVMVTNGSQTYWLKTHATNPCAVNSPTEAFVNHPTTDLGGAAGSGTPFQWTPSAMLGRVSIIRYFIRSSGGTSQLVRQAAGSDEQVVADDLTNLRVEYSTDGANFTNTPPAAQTRAVRLTLTGLRSRSQQNSTLTLSSTVFMRDIAATSTVTGP